MNDGTYVYYRIQHRDRAGRWVASGLGHLLFGHLGFNAKRGQKGRDYRVLLEQEHALWQKIGQDGFEHQADAERALATCRAEHPDMLFRLVRVYQTQLTEEVALACPTAS